MEDELPNELDLVVVGTGFVESIVASAASRIGKTVLHIDSNDFYGGTWASFNLEALQTFITNCQNKSEADINNFSGILNAHQTWHITTVPPPDEEAEPATESDEITWTKEKILKEFRKFNIDLSPKLLFSCGKLVNLLISSNICRYAEFRSVDRICTIINGQTKNVPCSRTDVFNTKDLNIVEKRLLMKLLTSCMGYDEHPEEFKDYENKTFLEYLQGVKLTENIIHCVLYSISMSNDSTPLRDGIERTKKFLNSLGRYGNTPFLFPMYGCGEIPQCFCRLCAVFGGIYCLKRPIEGVTTGNVEGKEVIQSLKCGKQDIKVGNVVLGHGNTLPALAKESNQSTDGDKNCGGLARGIFIASTPLGDEDLNTGGGGVNILKLIDDEGTGAFILQLSHYSGTCPKGLYLIHITCQSKTNNPEADIKPYLNQLTTASHPPTILYSVYFNIGACINCSTTTKSTHENVFTCCGPFFELDYDQSIENAESIFKTIYPNEEFLPRAPDPEEIVIGDEDPIATGDEVICLEDVKEQIKELEDGFEHAVKCIEENSINEEKDIELSEG